QCMGECTSTRPVLGRLTGRFDGPVIPDGHQSAHFRASPLWMGTLPSTTHCPGILSRPFSILAFASCRTSSWRGWGVQTSLVGRPVAELDTPALLIDLDPFERNIAAMAADIAARNCAWRPHVKVHKTPAIAHKQIAVGAIGVACAKVGEAEVMAAAGIRDILIANQIVGPIKTRRLAQLCHHADVITSVDAVENVRELDAAAKEYGATIGVAIEVNTGMQRSGTEAGAPSVALAQEI